jgi:hypothetical protein
LKRSPFDVHHAQPSWLEAAFGRGFLGEVMLLVTIRSLLPGSKAGTDSEAASRFLVTTQVLSGPPSVMIRGQSNQLARHHKAFRYRRRRQSCSTPVIALVARAFPASSQLTCPSCLLVVFLGSRYLHDCTHDVRGHDIKREA